MKLLCGILFVVVRLEKCFLPVKSFVRVFDFMLPDVQSNRRREYFCTYEWMDGWMDSDE